MPAPTIPPLPSLHFPPASLAPLAILHPTVSNTLRTTTTFGRTNVSFCDFHVTNSRNCALLTGSAQLCARLGPYTCDIPLIESVVIDHAALSSEFDSATVLPPLLIKFWVSFSRPAWKQANSYDRDSRAMRDTLGSRTAARIQISDRLALLTTSAHL
jgi:prepilin-type processing-associated H-X9-DG protein